VLPPRRRSSPTKPTRSAIEKHLPDVVVLPRSTDEVAAIVRWAHARRFR
jgi:FAD/FMN-containing dehydrogenase